jgi:hypothetical protein
MGAEVWVCQVSLCRRKWLKSGELNDLSRSVSLTERGPTASISQSVRERL